MQNGLNIPRGHKSKIKRFVRNVLSHFIFFLQYTHVLTDL